MPLAISGGVYVVCRLVGTGAVLPAEASVRIVEEYIYQEALNVWWRNEMTEK